MYVHALPPVYYVQFWRNTHDAGCGRFLRLYTDLPLDENARLESLHVVEINEAKIVLAKEATAMCRGREAAEAAAETARQTFALGGAGDDLPTLQVPEGEIGLIAANVQLGLASSNKQARQQVLEGAIRIRIGRAHV